MKYKVEVKKFIIYTIVVILAFFMVKKYGIISYLIKYIKFDTENFKFQDLLSIVLTVLSIFVGAIITLATVLISMCDKRVMKLISKYQKSHYVISTIKIAIGTGIASVILLAIVYAKLDLNILYFRIFILYLAGFLLLLFINNSRLLVKLTLSVLEDSFNEPGSSKADLTFKNPKM